MPINDLFTRREETPLVLGANGFLGSHLTEVILQETPWKVYATATTYEKAKSLARRFERVKRGRVQIARADVTTKEVVVPFVPGKDFSQDEEVPESIITDPRAIQEMKENATIAYNCTGSVEFMAPIEKLKSINTDSPLNTIPFFQTLPKRRLYVHTSTAYVNPTGPRIIIEGELIDRKVVGSNRRYEASKREGLLNVLRLINQGLDFVVQIDAPGIIVGNSNGGSSGGLDTTFNAYNKGIGIGLLNSQFLGSKNEFFAAYERGAYTLDQPKLVLRMKGDPNVKKRFICVDECARRMFWLSIQENPQNATYHLVGEPIQGSDVGRAVSEAFRFLDINYVGDKIPRPRTPVETFVAGLTSPYEPYIGEDNFDTSKSDQALLDVGYVKEVMNPDKFIALNRKFVREELMPALRHL
jgi:nucleoside-diphosphate-sugar epimerase